MNITVADIVALLEAGHDITVVINGEYYTVKEKTENED